jgi:hypothetical protein
MPSLAGRIVLAASAAHLAACGTVNPADPDAGPTELCSSAETELGDEDADGAVDEGCAWAFSDPHAMPAVFGTPWAGGVVEPTAIAPDGGRLFVIASDTPESQRRLWSLSRSPAGSFDPPRPIAGADLDGYSIGGAAISADLQTAVVSARPWPGAPDASDDDYDLYVARWDGQGLAALAPLTALSDAGLSDDRPALSTDGKEIVFARGRSLLHAVADDSGAFTSARVLRGVLDGDVAGPQLSRDRRTVFYAYRSAGSGPYSLYRADRADPDGEDLAASVQVSGLGKVPDGFAPVVSESTRELFFASAAGRGWGPNTHSLWRSRICRDGQACDLPQVDCPAGVRSEDGTHCYTAIDEMLARGDARARCQALGGADLVSIQSGDEQQLVFTRFGDRNRWLGAFDDRDGIAECNRVGMPSGAPLRCAFGWDAGEASTYANWAMNEPSDNFADVPEDCAILWYDDLEGGLHHGVWNDISCTYVYAVVCEAVLFPTW